MALSEENVPLELFISKITELQELIRHSEEILNNSLPPSLMKEVKRCLKLALFFCQKLTELRSFGKL